MGEVTEELGNEVLAGGHSQPANASKPVSRPRFREPEHLLARLGILGALLLLINLWAQRHLDIALLEEWKNTTLAAIILPLLASILSVIGTKTTQKGLRSRIRKGVALVVSNAVLVPVTVLFVGATLLFSSVTVVPQGASVPLNVLVREQIRFPKPGAPEKNSASAKTLEEKSDALRFVRRCSPFGRSYVIEVDGYQPYTFDLYPWAGARIRIEHDLTVAPSILVRVPVSLLGNLSGGTIELWSATESPLPMAQVTTLTNQGAVIFGRNLPVDPWRLSDWQHELRVAGADGQGLSSSYLKWKNHLLVPLSQTLEPGQELEAKFITRSKDIAAARKFILTSEPLQDILLNILKPNP